MTSLLFKFSVKAGAAGNSIAQPDPAQSLGKRISTTEWRGERLHDLFDAITADENESQTVSYRCLFLHNDDAGKTFKDLVLWVTNKTRGGADVALSVDPTPASDVGATNDQALEASSECAAPGKLTFSTPTSKKDGLIVGEIGPGKCKAIWIQRTATDSMTIEEDGATFNVEGFQ